jgi:hypothetical protein
MTIPHFSGNFSADSSATKYSDRTVYNDMIERTQNGGIQGRIQNLRSDLKLKKQSKHADRADEYIKSYLPVIEKQGASNYKGLKVRHSLRGESTPQDFIDTSLTRAERIEAALRADNIVDQPENRIIHNKYISPKFLNHANGSLEKYVAAKHAFATNADLARLNDRVKIKMLHDGSLRIQIKGPHFYSRKLHNETVKLPQELRAHAVDQEAIGQQEQGIAEFVNNGIRRAKNLAAGYNVPPRPLVVQQHQEVVEENN